MDIDQGYVLVAFKKVGDDIKEIPLESYYSFEGADKAREVLNEIISDDVTIFISSRRYYKWKGIFMNNKYLLDNCGEHDKIIITFPDDDYDEVIMSRDLIVDFTDTRFIAYKHCGTGDATFANLSEIKSIKIMHY